MSRGACAVIIANRQVAAAATAMTEVASSLSPDQAEEAVKCSEKFLDDVNKLAGEIEGA